MLHKKSFSLRCSYRVIPDSHAYFYHKTNILGNNDESVNLPLLSRTGREWVPYDSVAGSLTCRNRINFLLNTSWHARIRSSDKKTTCKYVNYPSVRNTHNIRNVRQGGRPSLCYRPLLSLDKRKNLRSKYLDIARLHTRTINAWYRYRTAFRILHCQTVSNNSNIVSCIGSSTRTNTCHGIVSSE